MRSCVSSARMNDPRFPFLVGARFLRVCWLLLAMLGYASCDALWGRWVVNRLDSMVDIDPSYSTVDMALADLASPQLRFDRLSLGTSSMQTLWSVWGSDADHVYAVGPDALVRCKAGNNSCDPLSPTMGLYSVWGSDASNVYVRGNNGYLVRCKDRDSTCTPQTLPPSNESPRDTLFTICGTDSSHVYLAGAHSTIVKFDGSNWNELNHDPTNGQLLRTSWGMQDAKNVYMAGDKGTVLRCSVSVGPPPRCSRVRYNISETHRTVWGSDAEHVYVAGDKGTIVRCADSNPACVPLVSNTTEDLFTMWGSDAEHVYVAGDNGRIVRCAASTTTCTLLNSDTMELLRSVWGSDANNVYFVGDKGTVVRCKTGSDRCTRLALDQNQTQNFKSVWGVDANNIYVVGDSGTILRGRWQ